MTNRTRSYVKHVHLNVDTSNVQGNIHYSRYAPDSEGQCWFCGKPTKKYRAFDYSKDSTGISGPYTIKETKSHIVLKIWTCEECTQKIDNAKDRTENYVFRSGCIVAIIVFITSLVLFLYLSDNTVGFSIAISAFIAAAGWWFGYIIGRIIAKVRVKEEDIVIERLEQHPEVKAVEDLGYYRLF